MSQSFSFIFICILVIYCTYFIKISVGELQRTNHVSLYNDHTYNDFHKKSNNINIQKDSEKSKEKKKENSNSNTLCSDIKDCYNCIETILKPNPTSNITCNWCSSTNSCMQKQKGQSNTCSVWLRGLCPCEYRKSCDTCVNENSCGWCGKYKDKGSCYPCTKSRCSKPLFCSHDWSATEDICPQAQSKKTPLNYWEIALIVVGSVLVLIFVATIIGGIVLFIAFTRFRLWDAFILWQRKRDRYTRQSFENEENDDMSTYASLLDHSGHLQY